MYCITLIVLQCESLVISINFKLLLPPSPIPTDISEPSTVNPHKMGSCHYGNAYFIKINQVNVQSTFFFSIDIESF